MRVERFNDESFKIFLTYEDIYECGLQKEEMKFNSSKVQATLQRIVERACEEINFYWEDSVEIEIYSLHEQGIVLLITQSLDLFSPYEEIGGIYDKTSEIIVCLPTIEEVIFLCAIFNRQNLVHEGLLFYYNDFYYLYLNNMRNKDYEPIRSIVLEYGILSPYSNHFLEEHGKTLVQKNVVQTIVNYFIEPYNNGRLEG